WRAPDAVAGAVRKVESAGLPDTLVVVPEAGHDGFDPSTDLVVVIAQRGPADVPGVAERRIGQAGDDPDLAQQVRRGGRQPALGRLDHAHRVLRGDEASGVVLAAAEAGQDERPPAGDQVAAVELGRDMAGE